jgi:hypothetical protein
MEQRSKLRIEPTRQEYVQVLYKPSASIMGKNQVNIFKVNYEVSAMELSIIFLTFVFLRVNIDLFLSSV